MIQKNEPISSKDFNKGLVTRGDILKPDVNQSPNCMNIKWNFDGSIQKRLGANTQNTITIGGTNAPGFIVNTGTSLNTQLQAYWPLDETSSTRFDVFDGCNLSQANNVGSVTGIRNLAASFVANDSMSLFRTTTSPLQTGNINFSMASWFYLESTGLRTIIGKRDNDLVSGGAIDSNTILLLNCDGIDGSTTFLDTAPVPHTMTAGGSAQVDTAQVKFGTGSSLYNGTNSYISTGDSADWTFGAADWTVDLWLRFSSVSGTQTIVSHADGNTNNRGWTIQFIGASTLRFIYSIDGVNPVAIDVSWSPVVDTWYHLAVVRSGNDLFFFVDGTQQGATQSLTGITFFDAATELMIGANNFSGPIQNPFNGWMDEIRISNVARWTSSFTPPTDPYAGSGSNPRNWEYWLYVNTDNVVNFEVSSTGSNATGVVRATSFGAVNTATWYNVVAWHESSGATSHIGVSLNLSATTASYTSGVRVSSANFTVGAIQGALVTYGTGNSGFMNGRIDETGFWKKVLSAQDRADLYNSGAANSYRQAITGEPWASFDFGAGTTRWYTVSVGTGIVASSNLGITFVSIASSRTQNYQYFERSKNVLIATSDSYDVPLYWPGSISTFMSTLAPNSAPLAKYSVNYNGFLILLNFMNSNGAIRNRGFAYADENLQLTDTWTDSFDLPSSSDDEITAAFILSKFLYVSTKYKIFRVAYTFGNPDWQFLKVKDFGYVPRTVEIVSIEDGQVAIGLDWNRRLRAFDGDKDVFMSDNVESDNEICDFATQKISLAGSGLVICNAELDQNEQEYRLNVAIGLNSSKTTHCIVLNARTLAMYPYSNQPYNTIVMAESAGRQFLLAADRSGYIHMLNTGLTDAGIAIDDLYTSPFLYKSAPEEVSKAHEVDLFFKPSSSGTIFYKDATEFSSIFSQARALAPLVRDSSHQNVRTIDTPSVQNIYQFLITSSMNRAEPWELTRYDYLQAAKGLGKGGR